MNDLSIGSLRRPYRIIALTTLITVILVALILIPLAFVGAAEPSHGNVSPFQLFGNMNLATWIMIAFGLVAVSGVAYGVNKLLI